MSRRNWSYRVPHLRGMRHTGSFKPDHRLTKIIFVFVKYFVYFYYTLVRAVIMPGERAREDIASLEQFAKNPFYLFIEF